MNLTTDNRPTDETHPVLLGRRMLETLKIGSNGSQLYVLNESGTWLPNGIEIVRRRLSAELGMGWSPTIADTVVTWLLDTAPDDPKAIEDGEAGS